MNNESTGAVLHTLDFVRRAGQVKRYHTEVVLKEQTVGEHSFNVAWLCHTLTAQAPMTALIMHALAHDAEEHITGDIPSPAKRAMGIRTTCQSFAAAVVADSGVRLPPLDEHNQHILDLADSLDGVLYCLREYELGNRLVKQVFKNYCAYVREQLTNYRSKWHDCFGAGAEYAESVALAILIRAETRYAELRGDNRQREQA